MSAPIKGMRAARHVPTGSYYVEDEVGSDICRIFFSGTKAKALAHQFAASGEVVEALERMIAIAGLVDGPSADQRADIRDARAALAKSQGED
jgi:hypothetical protein